MTKYEMQQLITKEIIDKLEEVKAKHPQAYLQNFMDHNPRFEGGTIILQDGRSLTESINSFKTVNPHCFKSSNAPDTNRNQNQFADLSPVKRLQAIRRMGAKA